MRRKGPVGARKQEVVGVYRGVGACHVYGRPKRDLEKRPEDHAEQPGGAPHVGRAANIPNASPPQLKRARGLARGGPGARPHVSHFVLWCGCVGVPRSACEAGVTVTAVTAGRPKTAQMGQTSSKTPPRTTEGATFPGFLAAAGLSSAAAAGSSGAVSSARVAALVPPQKLGCLAQHLSHGWLADNKMLFANDEAALEACNVGYEDFTLVERRGLSPREALTGLLLRRGAAESVQLRHALPSLRAWCRFHRRSLAVRVWDDEGAAFRYYLVSLSPDEGPVDVIFLRPAGGAQGGVGHVSSVRQTLPREALLDLPDVSQLFADIPSAEAPFGVRPAPGAPLAPPSLFALSQAGNCAAVEAWCARGAVGLNVLEDGHTPLCVALARAHPPSAAVATALALIRCGADVTLPTSGGDLPIHLASKRGLTEVVQVLLRHSRPRFHGVDVRNSGGATPAIAAICNGHIDTALLLIENGAAHGVAVDLSTPLHAACDIGSLVIAAKLLKTGASPFVKRLDGRTSMEVAFAEGHLAIAELLVHETLRSYEYSLTQPSRDGAIQFVPGKVCDDFCLKRLIVELTSGGAPSLLFASANGHAELVSFFLDTVGASFCDVPDAGGTTPLHAAVVGGHVDTAGVLWAKGARNVQPLTVEWLAHHRPLIHRLFLPEI